MNGAPITGSFASDAFARLRGWAVAAATPGSAGSLVFAACLGVAAFAAALASGPISAREAEAAAPAPRPDLPLTDVSVRTVPETAAFDLLAPIGAPPPPAVDVALDREVSFYWPQTPQTVAEAVAIREGPAAWAKVIRHARPGERLRINGRVDDAPDGPWRRVRLADGRDGYFAGRTLDASAFRRKRATETAQTAPSDVEAFADALGAPLMPAPPDEGPDPDVAAPPSF